MSNSYLNLKIGAQARLDILKREARERTEKQNPPGIFVFSWRSVRFATLRGKRETLKVL